LLGLEDWEEKKEKGRASRGGEKKEEDPINWDGKKKSVFAPNVYGKGKGGL